jgi:hypothetical protein
MNMQMSSKKKVLIVSTPLALSAFKSGASIRVKSIEEIIDKDFTLCTKVSSFRSISQLFKNFDLVIIVSFSNIWVIPFFCFKSAGIWLDMTDSINLTIDFYKKLGTPLRKKILHMVNRTILKFKYPFDLVTYISKRDRAADNELFKVDLTKFIIPNTIERYSTKYSAQTRFVFLGPLDYAPNRLGLQNLLTRLREGPNYKQLCQVIHIYGLPHYDLQNTFEEIKWHGYATYHPLSSDIHIAPIEFGAGIKNKVAEPLINGLYVLCTPEAAQGFISLPKLLVCPSIDEMAKVMSSWLENETVQNNLGAPPDRVFCDDESDQLKEFLNKYLS